MATPKHIFISRNLKKDSIFQALLEGKAVLEAQSLVEFEGLPVEELPSCDWLFFYSKKGLEFGWPSLKELASKAKIAVLGAASGEYFQKELGQLADFVGTGEPVGTAAAFLEVAKGKKVCFVQAQHSRQSVAKLLGNQVQAQSLVVYNNVPKAVVKLPVCDILVFTSPLNAQTYYTHYQPNEQQQVIAIGKTTAGALVELGIKNYLIAPAPHERALANCCLSLL